MVISPYTLRNIRSLFVKKENVDAEIKIYSLENGNRKFWTVGGSSYGLIEKKGDTWFAYPSSEQDRKTNVSHVIDNEDALKVVLQKCFHSGD